MRFFLALVVAVFAAGVASAECHTSTDLDGSGATDLGDLTESVYSIGSTDSIYDFDCDGDVDADDFYWAVSDWYYEE